MDLTRYPTAPVAALSLIAGYLLGRVTGNRRLAGVPPLVAAGWCASVWGRERGAATAAALTATYVAALGGSHPLAKKIGPWPSVLAVAGATGAAAWIFGDRPRLQH